MLATTLFVLACVSSFSQVESLADRRCVVRNCPCGKTCRVFKRCSLSERCYLVAECLDKPFTDGLHGVCDVGEPILVVDNGTTRDLYCYRDHPCPNGSYCNDKVMDTYATCCVSDPDAAVKSGECPRSRFSNSQTVVIAYCNNDGDCLYGKKCCTTGTTRRCAVPL